jgi:hypothetical protein
MAPNANLKEIVYCTSFRGAFVSVWEQAPESRGELISEIISQAKSEGVTNIEIILSRLKLAGFAETNISSVEEVFDFLSPPDMLLAA